MTTRCDGVETQVEASVISLPEQTRRADSIPLKARIQMRFSARLSNLR
jgi:hypothetical protein